MALSSTASQEEKNAHYRAVLRAYAEAVSRDDAAAANALFADDGGIDDPVGVVRARGREEVRGFFEKLKGRGVRLDVTGAICSSKSNAAVMPVRAVIAAAGVELNCICVGQFNDAGLIHRYLVYWGPGDNPGKGPDATPPKGAAPSVLKSGASQEEKNAHYRAQLHAYIGALNRDDMKAAAALFADNGMIEDPVGTLKATGRAEIDAFYKGVGGRGVQMKLSGPICTSRGNAAAMPVVAGVPAKGMGNIISVAHFNEQGLIERYMAHWGPGDDKPA